MRLIALALLSSLALAAHTQSYGLDLLTPFQEKESDEAHPPLAFRVYVISNLADARAAQREAATPLLSSRAARPVPSPNLSAIPILVRITNRSNRDVVLPDFCHEMLDFLFYCSSPEARCSDVEEDFMLPLDCVVLRPQESTYALDYMKGYIYFLRSGHYEVDYQFPVGYAYADHPIPGKEKAALEYRYRQNHVAEVHGKLDVFVGSDQVYKPPR